MKKVRLTLIAAAVLLSVGGAYATKANHSAKAGTYGILSEDANYYYVTSDPGTCSGSGDCEITTSDNPDSQGRVPKDQNTSVSQHGTFLPD